LGSARAQIALAGVLSFCLGAFLLLRSFRIGTGFLLEGRDPKLLDVAEIARAGAIYQIASPLMWLGIILIILSAAATLYGQQQPPPKTVSPPPLAPFRRPQPRKEKLLN
jgi:hypothetical protein